MTILLRSITMHLLIVDDDETVRASLRDALATDTVQVSEAAGVVEALERIAAVPVDLVLTDVRMPGLNGLELLRHVRSSAPGVDVVVMTAYEDRGVLASAVQDGARAFLSKPLDLGDLRSVIERLLTERAERHQAADPFP
jgi:DNA-binding NtrC family response regulator